MSAKGGWAESESGRDCDDTQKQPPNPMTETGAFFGRISCRKLDFRCVESQEIRIFAMQSGRMAVLPPRAAKRPCETVGNPQCWKIMKMLFFNLVFEFRVLFIVRKRRKGEKF